MPGRNCVAGIAINDSLNVQGEPHGTATQLEGQNSSLHALPAVWKCELLLPPGIIPGIIPGNRHIETQMALSFCKA